MKQHGKSCNISFGTKATDLPSPENKKESDVSIYTTSKALSLKKRKRKNGCEEPLWKCRYNIVLASFLIFFYATYIRLNMSIGIVAMVNNSAMNNLELSKSDSCPVFIENVTEGEKRDRMEGEFNWSPKIQGYILASFSFQFFTQIPAGLLVERYGTKWFLFASTLITAVCTLLIPVLSYINVFVLMAVLMLRGLIQGFVQPALAVIVANWFPKTERGFLFAFTMSGTCLGFCLGSIFSGLICDSKGGWSASFYVTGAGGIFLSILLLFILFENPKEHPRISTSELNFIVSNQENVLLRKRPKLPWRKMLTSVPVYALAINFFGQAWAISQIWTVHSTFLATIHHFPIKENGLLTALPFGLQFLVSQITCTTSFYIQKKKICGVGFLRKFWNFTASVGISSCLLGMYLSGCNRSWSVIFSILTTGCTGILYSGCWIIPADMTPTFAGTLNAFCLCFADTSAFLGPVLIGYLTDGMQTIEQWYKVFFISIGITMSSSTFFAIFGSAEIQSWNFTEEQNTENDKKETNVFKKEPVNNKNEEQTSF